MPTPRSVSDFSLAPRSVIDYSLARRAVLADLLAGRTSAADVCDAHPYLLRAARFHGTATDVDCPVCRRERLTEVRYGYGDELRAGAGHARSVADLARLDAECSEFAVYVVEVCRGCGWNQLVRSYLLGSAPEPARGRRRSTASAGTAGTHR